MCDAKYNLNNNNLVLLAIIMAARDIISYTYADMHEERCRELAYVRRESCEGFRAPCISCKDFQFEVSCWFSNSIASQHPPAAAVELIRKADKLDS
jgi:hypothetical protein